MKAFKLALTTIGIAALGIGGVMLYRKNLKKIKKEEEAEKKEFEALGIEVDKLDEDAVNTVKDDPNYGDVKRFSDLPVPQQVVRLLQCSSNWSDEDLDWVSCVYSDNGAHNAVHVVFKEDGSEDGFPNNKVGFFIEVPPLISRGKDSVCNLKYSDYANFLNQATQDFWATHKVECARPRDAEVIGLYSQAVSVPAGHDGVVEKNIRVLQYSRIPDEVLISRSRYNSRLDGLYSYYSDAKRESEKGNCIIPDEMDDIHIFMGVWFKLEYPETKTYGMKIKQILQFLEELVLNDNYVIEDYNHKNQQKLGPVIVHPGSELEFILNEELKSEPIVFDD